MVTWAGIECTEAEIRDITIIVLKGNGSSIIGNPIKQYVFTASCLSKCEFFTRQVSCDQIEPFLPPEWPISVVDNSVAERWKKVLLPHCSSGRANPMNFPHTKQRRILSGRSLPRKTSILKSLGDPNTTSQGHHRAYRQHAYPFQQDEKYVAHSFIPSSPFPPGCVAFGGAPVAVSLSRSSSNLLSASMANIPLQSSTFLPLRFHGTTDVATLPLSWSFNCLRHGHGSRDGLERKITWAGWFSCSHGRIDGRRTR